jgi:hypothetical protein
MPTSRRPPSSSILLAGALAGALLVGGCDGGGGSSGDDGAIRLTFEPAELVRTMREGDPDREETVAVAFSAMPSDVKFVRIEYGNALTQSPAIWDHPDGSFDADLTLNNRLPVGVNEGVIGLKLCRDDNCTNWYPTAPTGLAYRITILPLVSAVVKVNGMTRPETGSIDSFGVRWYSIGNVPAGATIELDTTLPMTWHDEMTSSSTVVTPLETSTPTAWQATFTVTPGAYGQLTGQTRLVGVAADGETMKVDVRIGTW